MHSFRPYSLKARMTFLTLAVILVISVMLALYTGKMLHDDMRQLLGDKQQSTTVMLASQVEESFRERFQVLESMAVKIDARLLRDFPSLAAFLHERMAAQAFFNGGILAFAADGKFLAGSAQFDLEHATHDPLAIERALREGGRIVSRPVRCATWGAPVFDLVVPIRDGEGTIVGALAGVTRLDKNNFLDWVVHSTYGRGGGILVVAPQYRLVVTSSDSTRMLDTLPPAGANALVDRFLAGYEGFAIGRNSRGEEILATHQGIPSAGWGVGLFMPVAEAFAPIDALERRMLVGLALMIALGGLSIWWLQARLLHPITAATRALAEQQRSGGFPVPLPTSGRRDEIGELIGGFNDLLDRLKEREEALRESEDSLQATLAALPDLIFEMGLDGLIHDCHPQSCPERYFVPPLEFLGKRAADVLPLEAGAVIMAALQEAHERGRSTGWRYTLRMPQGQRWYELSVSRKAIQSEAQPRFIVLARDITERWLAEERLRELAASLEAQVEERTRQLKSISAQLAMTEERERRALAEELHDNLGQLLAAIKIQLSMLDGGERGEAIRAIVGLVEKADRVVRTLTQHWSPPILKVVGFAPALEALCEDLQRFYGIAVHSDIRLCDGKLSEETQALLLRSIRELLINVAKHARARKANLSVGCDGEHLVTIVRDTGRGFDPDRLAGSSGRLSFGLASIRERIEALGGEMTLVSRPGMGATVTLALPCSIVAQACPSP